MDSACQTRLLESIPLNCRSPAERLSYLRKNCAPYCAANNSLHRTIISHLSANGDSMSLAELAYQELQRLPQPILQEVIDFIGYLEQKHGIYDANVMLAQSESLSKTWDTPEDDAWNDFKPV